MRILKRPISHLTKQKRYSIFDNVIFHTSEEVYEDIIRENNEYVAGNMVESEFMTVLNRIFDSELEKLLNANAKLIGNRSVVVLNAHGDEKDGVWAYRDTVDNLNFVQDWLNKNQDYNLALLLCCNPGNKDIRSKRSIIAYPDDTISAKDFPRHNKRKVSECEIRYYVPALKETISSYELEYAAKKTEQALR